MGGPKTPHSRRTIPLTPRAADCLKQHRAAQLTERLASGGDWNPDQFVFCTGNGTAYAKSNWRLQHYRRLIAMAGLLYIRPHDLRHTAATILLA